MRKSDIFVTIIVALIGTIAAFFIVNMLLGNPDERFEKYKTIKVIEPSLTNPDESVFNVMAINPTVEVFVGNCEDVDQNGELDRAELVLCGRIKEAKEGEEDEESEDDVDFEVIYGWDDEETGDGYSDDEITDDDGWDDEWNYTEE